MQISAKKCFLTARRKNVKKRLFWPISEPNFFSTFILFLIRFVFQIGTQKSCKKWTKNRQFWGFINWQFSDHFLMSFRGYFLFPFYSLFNTFWVLKLEPKIVSKKSQKSTISKIDNFWFLGGHFVEAKKFKNAIF